VLQQKGVPAVVWGKGPHRTEGSILAGGAIGKKKKVESRRGSRDIECNLVKKDDKLRRKDLWDCQKKLWRSKDEVFVGRGRLASGFNKAGPKS